MQAVQVLVALHLNTFTFKKQKIVHMHCPEILNCQTSDNKSLPIMLVCRTLGVFFLIKILTLVCPKRTCKHFANQSAY